MQNNLQRDSGIYLVNCQPFFYDDMVTKYSDYKKGTMPVEELNEKEKVEVETLNILEELGYSLKETGTYFYKDIIVKVIDQLQKSASDESYQELISDLNNDYSQFYFDIARNGYDIGLKTFHSCIKISRQNRQQIDSELEKKLGVDELSMNYKQEALLIADYIEVNQPRKELPQIKQKAINY